MKLNKVVVIEVEGQSFDVELSTEVGMVGALPVFDTYEQAVESSYNGKYGIVPVEASNEAGTKVETLKAIQGPKQEPKRQFRFRNRGVKC